jgi:ABC-type uncharacterized transport system ATPase subunit|tara:strand:+ start:247 stop:522 length:276 start_codon:yes stop_codon:yes gene_type:complete
MKKFNNKKKKFTKKDLKNISLERIMKDMDVVNNLVDKINTFEFGEDLEENKAEEIKKDLKEVETYLKGQYGKYLDSDLDFDDLDEGDNIKF